MNAYDPTLLTLTCAVEDCITDDHDGSVDSSVAAADVDVDALAVEENDQMKMCIVGQHGSRSWLLNFYWNRDFDRRNREDDLMLRTALD